MKMLADESSGGFAAAGIGRKYFRTAAGSHRYLIA